MRQLRFFLTCTVALAAVWLFVVTLGTAVQPVIAAPSGNPIIINEVEADTPSTDVAEFIELYDGGAGNSTLNGLVLVFYNGSNDLSYQAFDLDGQSTDANGYFVLCGDAANVPNCDLDVTPNSDLIQNGQDAAALYQANASDFPLNTPVTTVSLVDALVYDTNDPDDPGLLVLLNAGQPQVNEGAVNPAGDSNQRCPNGTGGARNTNTYEQHPPTPGTENVCGSGIDLELVANVTPAITDEGETITYTIDIDNDSAAGLIATGVIVSAYLPDTTGEIENVSNDCGAVTAGDTLTWTVGTLAIGAADSCTITATVSAGTFGTTLVLDAEVSAANETDLDSTPGNLSGAPTEDDEARVTADVGIPAACAVAPTHLIHQIQGSGDSSPIVGNMVTVQAVVVGDFQTTLNGFHIQEEVADQDSNLATSEGLFIFNNSTPVNVGDLVRVQGTVAEFSGLTELTSATITLCSQGNVITPMVVALPLATGGTWEPYEGMLIEVQDLVVTDNFRLGRFGQVRLATHLLAQPTNVAAPGAPANALQDLNNRSYVTLDDGRTTQNADPMVYPAPELSYTNTLRGGDEVGQVIGIIDHFNTDSADDYRLHPTQPVSFTAVNVRQEMVPAVGGTIQVASFNVLNYFSTLDGSGNICGPLANVECRGADSALEFQRQYTKIVNAIVEIDAAVVGLMEIENNAADEAVIDLVTRLNAVAGAGVYDYIDTGVIGTDAIKQALIYQPAHVTPIGAYTILDSSVDPLFDDTRNRPVIIQTFEENSSGERFTVAVNHLKSKGSACSGDPDTGDGQGNCNVTRTNAATALVNYLATDPTGSGSDYTLIIGDLNAYAMEDPIMAIEAAGYTNLISHFGGVDAYGYQFNGQWGYLDHGLASDELLPFVTDAVEWHINADEPIVFDYNVEFKTANQINIFYNPSAFRSSDHDPVILGLDFTMPPVLTSEVGIAKEALEATVSVPNGMVSFTLHISNTGVSTATHVVVTDTLPTELVVMTYTTDLAVTNPITSPMVWEVADLAAGDSGTITVVAMLADNDLPDSTVLTNTAEISADNDASTANNTASASVTVDNPVVPTELRLTLLHNNDGESSLLPTTNTAEGLNLTVGGVDAFKSVMEAQEAAAASLGNAFMNVYAGDAFLASAALQCVLPPTNGSFFDAIAQTMLPYTAHIIGNHEFDYGPQFLAQFIGEFGGTQPFLTSNLDFSGEPSLAALYAVDGLIEGAPENDQPLARSMVYTDTTTGARFGIVGATTPLLPTISSPGNVTTTADITTTATAVQMEVDRLETMGVNKIVFVSHMQDLAYDIILLGMLDGIDIAVGGGGDQILANSNITATVPYTMQLLPGETEPIYGQYPLEVEDTNGDTVYLVTAKGQYKYIGRLDVVFNETGEITEVIQETSYPRRVIPNTNDAGTLAALGVTDAVTPDATMITEIIEPLEECLEGFDSTNIAFSEVVLEATRNIVRGSESNLGNLIADGFIYTYELFDTPSNPVVALQNGGGIRQTGGDEFEGVITRRNTIDILPFNNTLVVIRGVDAATLKEVFEHAVAGALPRGGFLQVGGVEVSFNLLRPVGSRVVNISLADGTAVVQNGEVVADAPEVDLVTNSFTAGGGDGYAMLASLTRELITDNTQQPISYERALLEYLQGDSTSFPLNVDGLPTIQDTDVRYQVGGEGRLTFVKTIFLPMIMK